MLTSEVVSEPHIAGGSPFPVRAAAAFQTAVGAFVRSYIGGRLTVAERDALFRAVDTLLETLPHPAPPPESVLVALKQLVWSCGPVITSPLAVRRKLLEVLVTDCIDVYFDRSAGEH